MTASTRITATITFVILLTVPAIFGEALKSADANPVSLIQRAYENKSLTADQRAIYTVRAIKNPSLLPDEFKVSTLADARYVTRDITMALRDIKMNWDSLSDSAQAIVNQAMTRWSTAFTYVSPSGFFKLHYDTVGTNAVPATDADHDGVPDYVEKCASYADTSMDRQLALGYYPPPSDGTMGGDSKYDVYFENMAYYGYAQPESAGPQPWNDYTSYLVLHRNFLGFPNNNDPEGKQAGAAKATCAHELHHAIQFAYDATEVEWFMELDATYIEDIVFDQVNDNYNYLSSFFGSPETSLMATTIHEYSCFVWGMYLAQRFDTSLMVAAWEGARYNSIYNVVNDTLLGRYGWTEDSAFAEFEAWNYCTNVRNDGLHHAEASSYPLVTIGRTHTTFPTLTQSSPSNPAGYAASYVQFIPGSYTGKLRITFDGLDSRKWAAYIIKSTASNVHQFEKMVLDPVTFTDTVDVLGFQNYSAITLIGINLSPNSSAASFAYSAQVLQPYEVASEVVTDSQVYAGAARTLTLKAKNPSPLSDVVRLVWSDQRNWMTTDSISTALAAGDSVITTRTIKAPVGTPLGIQSEIRLRAYSLNDPGITAWDSTAATVVVQRGDCNFDGTPNLGDLSYLVSYLTAGGIPPIPILEAGNANCSGTVDLGDVSYLVAYLTGAAPRPPCNPY